MAPASRPYRLPSSGERGPQLSAMLPATQHNPTGGDNVVVSLSPAIRDATWCLLPIAALALVLTTAECPFLLGAYLFPLLKAGVA
jgi:hypothetical protein